MIINNLNRTGAFLRSEGAREIDHLHSDEKLMRLKVMSNSMVSHNADHAQRLLLGHLRQAYFQ
jgi:hypothetical protein